MRRSRKSALALIVGSILMMACGKEIPADIIQPDDMENLLFDYHMASSMAYSLPYNETYRKEAYYKYVFCKHKVTEAEFDSSMVWYTRHSKVLAEIYTRLGKRFKNTEDQLKFQAEKREGRSITVFLPGDSVEIWQDRTIYWLTPAELTNKVTFEFKVDTTFKPMDRLELAAEFTWIPGGNDSTHTAIMGLSAEFKNDSIFGKTLSVAGQGRYKLVFQPDVEKEEFEKVRGFIYYSTADKQGSHLLVNRISLRRYHQKEEVLSVPGSDSGNGMQ